MPSPGAASGRLAAASMAAGADAESPHREMVLALARGWLGTPFCHQGRVRGVGVDCIGLVVGVARGLGLAVEDRADYPRSPDGVSLGAALEAHLRLVPAEMLCPGDVVLFRIRRLPQHVGILGEAGTMIHAYSGAGGVVEVPLSDWWWERLVAGYRFP